MANFNSAVALLKKPFDQAYDAASDALKNKLKIMKTEAKIKNLHAKIYETQKIKTIWNTERPLSISRIYYPVSIVSSSGDGLPTKIKSLSDFPDNYNIIYGTVGQGKSIFLRYLVGSEIRSGIRVPVFIELRNVESGGLEDLLKIKFSDLLSIDRGDDIFEYFARSGRFSFFLDGFDEVDPENSQKILNSIEALSYKYGGCRFLLSSRLDSGCGALTRFCENSICEISETDLPAFYRKITNDENFSAKIISAIKFSPTKIKELVTTPLLATLLAISYRSAQKIPLEFSEFYEELFQILLVRHDGLKLGWKRTRKTKLNDRQIQQIFEAFCFDSRKRRLSYIESDLAYVISENSIKELEIDANGVDFVDDISKITCLLIKEGKRFNFVHASVQEFFASRYIKTRAEPVAKVIYEKLYDGKWKYWNEEILFLRQIDQHRLNKYFIHPDILRTINDFKSKGATVDEMVFSYLSSMYLICTNKFENGELVKKFNVDYSGLIDTYHYFQARNNSFNHLFTKNYRGASHWSIMFYENKNLERASFYDVSVSRGSEFHDEFMKINKGKFSALFSECAKIGIDIEKSESIDNFNAI